MRLAVLDARCSDRRAAQGPGVFALGASMIANIIPPDEMGTLPDLDGRDVVELGNKKNHAGRYREVYEALGVASYTCIDWNGQDGALPLDLRQPIPEQFHASADVVTNFGFSEHVTEQRPLWENVLRLLRPGGYLCCVTPHYDHWPGHGYWQPTLNWYARFAAHNGLGVEQAYTNRRRERYVECVRLRFDFPGDPEVHLPEQGMRRTTLPFRAEDLERPA